jgi:uncharacterized protein DUF5641
LAVKPIKWIFNPPTAAWWGGWWERLVRTLKDLLRKMLGTARLTFKGLTSCLSSVSYVVNNRPLTTLNEDTDDLTPLTPSMFMKDLPVSGLPEQELMTSKDPQDSYRKIQNLKTTLKARFRKEYLSQLIQKSKEKAGTKPEVGNVVFVEADNKKRCLWPIGRIMELYPGKDGKIRVAKVKTTTGIFIRPLQRLYHLEFSNPKIMPCPSKKEQQNVEDDLEEDTLQADEELPIKTKRERIIKKPQRFGTWRK